MNVVTEGLLIVGLWTFAALRPVPESASPLEWQLKAPTATERMIFEFHEDGTDRLRWELLDEGKFCERRGRYQWSNNELTTTVTSLHPDNDASCAGDPDMVLGETTVTAARIENSQLILTLPVAADRAELVFERGPNWCPKDAARLAGAADATCAALW